MSIIAANPGVPCPKDFLIPGSADLKVQRLRAQGRAVDSTGVLRSALWTCTSGRKKHLRNPPGAKESSLEDSSFGTQRFGLQLREFCSDRSPDAAPCSGVVPLSLRCRGWNVGGRGVVMDQVGPCRAAVPCVTCGLQLELMGDHLGRTLNTLLRRPC